MKTIFKSIIITITLVFMFIADVPFLFELLVPEAEAIYGVRRRTRRRTAVVVGSVAAANTAAAQQQAAAAQQQAAAAKQEAAAAKQQSAAVPAAPPPAAAGKPLPLGTVVTTLPAGCTSTPVGVQYYNCGADTYRAVFQGNTLVYVTAEP
jgi:hypothetical protein